MTPSTDTPDRHLAAVQPPVAAARELLVRAHDLLDDEEAPLAFAASVIDGLVRQLDDPNPTLISAAWSLLARDGDGSITDELMLALAKITDLAAVYACGDGTAMQGVELVFRLEALQARIKSISLTEA